MNPGSPTKKCKRDGCESLARARGMCNNHYTQWHRKLPGLIGISRTKDEVRAAMPAKTCDIAASLNMKYETVRKAISELHAAGLVHIEDAVQDKALHGTRYVSVWADGPGKDFKVSRKTVKENALASRRSYYRRTASKPRNADPLVSALFGFAL